MKKYVIESGLAAVMDRVNVDTDQIIPKQFLKRIERSGFGQFLFFDWRFDPKDGSENPAFELNLPRYRGASVLVAGDNFGCGSSREHAPWALADYGFRTLIAPSFADIFYNNCFKNGILPIKLPQATVDALMRRIEGEPGARLTIDLPAQEVRAADNTVLAKFEVDAFRKHCLLEGLDDIGLTLQQADKIAAYEKRHELQAV
ncbi:MAG TPA: 3-isopropylmalate dehydratase small subunit [Limnochordia bacterium]|nr:3-isopropylmalate dehydratase small subunit [Limnochordia bacterium]